MHWSTQAGTSSSVRDPYPARGLILHRRPLSGLPPHSRGERRIKRRGIAAGTATGAALGTKSNAKAERKCQNFALVTTLFSGSASPQLSGAGRHSTFCLPLQRAYASTAALCPSSPGCTKDKAHTPLSRDVCASPWSCVISWSKAPHGCTPCPPWSSLPGSLHGRSLTGGILLRASCPAACRSRSRSCPHSSAA